MPDVVAALEDLRSSLSWPDPAVDLTTDAVSALRPRRRQRWPVVAVAAVVVVGAGVPAAAHYLSLGGVRVELGAEMPEGLGRELLLGRPTAVRERAPRPPSLGAPAEAFEGRPEGGYTEVWPGPVLLTSFPGRLDGALIEKRVFEGGTVTATTVDGSAAYWISASHAFLYVDEHGRAREDTVRLSGNALVWTRDGITYRLESGRSLSASIELAESMFSAR